VPHRKKPLTTATLERQTSAYFEGLTAEAAVEENDLEDALSAATRETDFDRAPASGTLWSWS
jgi:hypothetical protein